MTDTTREPRTDWTDLANDIRRVDGNHDLGAGALAEALIERGWTKAAPPPAEAVEALRALVDAVDEQLRPAQAVGGWGDSPLSQAVDEAHRIMAALPTSPPALDVEQAGALAIYDAVRDGRSDRAGRLAQTGIAR